MRVLLTSTAAAAFLALSLPAAPAFAFSEDCDVYGIIVYCEVEVPVPAPEPECDCVPNALDILQSVKAAQTATNVIKDFKTVEDVTQSAVNVANSVSIDDDFANVPKMSSLTQHSSGFQFASNYLEFGGGGYDGPEFNLNKKGELPDNYNPTQTALNASNLINVPDLGAPVLQTHWTSQTAINTAAFDGQTYGGYGYNGDVRDLSQMATNVANSISVTEEFFTFKECECVEIEQYAYAPQLAQNSITGAGSSQFGLLQSAIQNATNIANSINGSVPE